MDGCCVFFVSFTSLLILVFSSTVVFFSLLSSSFVFSCSSDLFLLLLDSCFVVFLLLFSVFFVPKTQVYAAEREVYVGGMPAGFLMRLDGVQVVGFSGVVSQDGSVSPSEEAGLKIGDVIVSFDGEKVNSSDDLEHALAASDRYL